MPRPRDDDRAPPSPLQRRFHPTFLFGVATAAAVWWALNGDAPPGLPGEPDLRPYEGAPLLVVYGAPWCRDCAAEWRALEPTLPDGLTVLHLATSTERGRGHPATEATVQAWAATLGVPEASVRPADLTHKHLPALLLRDATGRWRFEHTGRLDRASRAALARALAHEGLDASPSPSVPSPPTP